MTRRNERIDTSGGRDLKQSNPFSTLSGEGLPQAKTPDQAKTPKPVRRDTAKPRETLNLRRLKAGKGGKVVTEISGFDAHPEGLDKLLKRLQSRLGAGGTRKGKILELQGECRQTLKPILENMGYRVKGI